MRSKRGERSGAEVAEVLGITSNSYYRLERGEHQPSMVTAEKLATWLGWTVGQVIDAARRPPEE